MLTSAEVTKIAQAANFLVEFSAPGATDSVLLSGDGVDDLDHLIALARRTLGHRMLIDAEPADTSFKPCNIADLQAIRASFVSFYGEVAKEDEFDSFADSTRRVGTAFYLLDKGGISFPVTLTADTTLISADATYITADATTREQAGRQFDEAPVYGVQGYTDHELEFVP
jgi:hypothetical protein